jgi:outer membrane protein OmpA-like peptidoglycan-associated protein
MRKFFGLFLLLMLLAVPAFAQDYPKAELFGGYSYLRVNPGSGLPGVNANGWNAALSGNVNDWFGVTAQFTGHYGDIFGVSGSMYSYMFGPRFASHKNEKWTPFVHFLFGGAHASGGGVSENAFAMDFGGGFDYNASDHVGIRIVQFDYVPTRFSSDWQHNFAISTGIVFRFGGNPPPPPPPPPNRSPVATCSAEKSTAYAGDVVAVRAQTSDPDNDRLTYSWTTTGGTVEGSGPEVRWSSSGTTPGTYAVKVRVDDSRGGTADCSVDIRVEPRPNRAPSLTCSADRSSVLVGERVRITGQGNDPDGDRLTYSWRADAGQIVGSGSSVQFDTSGLAPGRYTITGRVDDGKGGAGDCTVSVGVEAPPPPPQASKINECFLRAGSARVDNVCKRILDDVALRMQNEPRAKIVVVGFADPKEARPDRLAGQRGEAAKKYVTDKGIAGTRIDVRTAGGQAGAGKQNHRIDIVWVPEGATY